MLTKGMPYREAGKTYTFEQRVTADMNAQHRGN